MELTELEKSILTRLLHDSELHPVKVEIDFGKISVTSRDFTPVGFLANVEPSDELRLFSPGVALRWGKVGARLNASKIESGFVIYVDDGRLTTIEGYTYGDDWPERISSYEIYDLKLGMELGQRSDS